MFTKYPVLGEEAEGDIKINTVVKGAFPSVTLIETLSNTTIPSQCEIMDESQQRVKCSFNYIPTIIGKSKLNAVVSIEYNGKTYSDETSIDTSVEAPQAIA